MEQARQVQVAAGRHTPGPWARVDLEDYATIRADADEGSPVALVGRVADADLIAEAPAMLALLALVDEHIERLDHGQYALNACEGFDSQLFVDSVRRLLAKVAA